MDAIRTVPESQDDDRVDFDYPNQEEKEQQEELDDYFWMLRKSYTD